MDGVALVDLPSPLGGNRDAADRARLVDVLQRLEDAVETDALDSTSIERVLNPAVRAVDHLPRFVCRDADLDLIRTGREIPFRPEQFVAPNGIEVTSARSDGGHTCGTGGDHGSIAVQAPSGELVCIAQFGSGSAKLQPRIVLLR